MFIRLTLPLLFSSLVNHLWCSRVFGIQDEDYQSKSIMYCKTGFEIYSTVLTTHKAHNGCRPAKNRRKKIRTKVKGIG